MKTFFSLCLLLFISCSSHPDLGPNLNVRRVVLPNGFKALLVKTESPVPLFSAYLRIRVGNIEESSGASGLAHFFEHMAFKGTPTIGTKDFEQEKKNLAEQASLGSEIVRKKKEGASSEVLSSLKMELALLQKEGLSFVEQNEFVRIYQKNGSTDLNATTSNDYTSYFVSLPASKLELWAYMESERLKHPVFREFYKERDVVAEERRMRYENSPDGRLYEALMDTAFDGSPYKINVIGSAEDIQNYTFEVAQKFRDTYYMPSRMVLSVVGSFDLNEAEKYIKKYFSDLPSQPEIQTPHYEQKLDASFPRSKVLTGPDEPRFYVGFHRPAYPHPDDEVFDVIQSLLCDGRTSRLYSRLVLEKKIALSINCDTAMPGSRLDSLFAFYAEPLPPFKNTDVEKEILSEIEKVQKEGITSEELEKVKNHVEASLIWALHDNMGLATMLTFYESLSGDWHYIYDLQKKIAQITSEDVKRVSSSYFVPQRRVSVYLEKE